MSAGRCGSVGALEHGYVLRSRSMGACQHEHMHECMGVWVPGSERGCLHVGAHARALNAGGARACTCRDASVVLSSSGLECMLDLLTLMVGNTK